MRTELNTYNYRKQTLLFKNLRSLNLYRNIKFYEPYKPIRSVMLYINGVSKFFFNIWRLVYCQSNLILGSTYLGLISWMQRWKTKRQMFSRHWKFTCNFGFPNVFDVKVVSFFAFPLDAAVKLTLSYFLVNWTQCWEGITIILSSQSKIHNKNFRKSEKKCTTHCYNTEETNSLFSIRKTQNYFSFNNHSHLKNEGLHWVV